MGREGNKEDGAGNVLGVVIDSTTQMDFSRVNVLGSCTYKPVQNRDGLLLYTLKEMENNCKAQTGSPTPFSIRQFSPSSSTSIAPYALGLQVVH